MNPNPQFCTKRVQSFAVFALEKMLKRRGYENVDSKLKKFIVTKCEFKKIDAKLVEYSQIKHSGKYGPLEQSLQKDLNLRLFAYDLAGKGSNEKHSLIQSIIQKSDNYKKNKEQREVESEFIKEMIKEMDFYDHKFQSLFLKMDTLFLIRKNELRKHARDEEEYNRFLKQLTDIFSKYIDKAISLQHEKILAR